MNSNKLEIQNALLCLVGSLPEIGPMTIEQPLGKWLITLSIKPINAPETHIPEDELTASESLVLQWFRARPEDGKYTSDDVFDALKKDKQRIGYDTLRKALTRLTRLGFLGNRQDRKGYFLLYRELPPVVFRILSGEGD